MVPTVEFPSDGRIAVHCSVSRSQTSWVWLEAKLVELEMVGSDKNYKVGRSSDGEIYPFFLKYT